MPRAWDTNPWSEGESSQGFLKDRFPEEGAHQCHQQYSTEANTYKQCMSGSLAIPVSYLGMSLGPESDSRQMSQQAG